ncbi:Scn10a [Symbiodinium natans]|uniref:Scn10a protein n=1 Tax=Symbiodinium natans TaxID=878477 RepID=A0A812SS31_9DINO|nr:Scn10a [Symbiodinium natans]
MGSRSTSRIRNTVTDGGESSAAAKDLKLAQERRNGFDTVVGVAVLLNALVMVVDLESQGNNVGVTIGLLDQSIWASAAPVILVLEHLFVAIFLLELAWRIYSERLRYFKELMNVFDSILVLIACIDLYILTPLIQTSLNNTATLRLLRTIKLVRAVRIVRALRLFRGLRLLVQACSSFLPSLCWSMALLGIFMMMGALFMGNLLQDFILDDENDFEIREWIWRHYGTAYRAIYTMYEMTFAGNWPIYARPVLENAGHGYVVFYMVYITFVVFAVIRVISAIFLRETLEAANNDAEILVQERLRKKATYVRKLESIFRACDESGDGVLTEDELNELMQDVRVQVYLESLEIDVHESTALFHLLQNGEGQITCDDFIDGILRCKGPARAIDQILLASDVKNLTSSFQQLYLALADANVIAPSKKNMGLNSRRAGSRLQDELALLPSVQMTLSGRYVMT